MESWGAVWIRLWHDSVLPFVNSTFFTALMGAGAGAWAGAYAAQKIAARSKVHDELLAEIRNTNSGVALAGMICNSCLALKKQHIKRLKEIYDEKKAELLALRKNPAAPTIFKFTADFQTIPPITIPNETFEALQKIVFEKISASSRATTLVPTLIQSINYFNSASADRNRLIEEIRASNQRDNQEYVAQFYFGLPDSHGHTDNRYGSVVGALSSYIDDCLFFSKAIADDLASHGKEIREQFKRKFKNETAEVKTFKVLESHQEFLPSTNNYPGWERLT